MSFTKEAVAVTKVDAKFFATLIVPLSVRRSESVIRICIKGPLEVESTVPPVRVTVFVGLEAEFWNFSPVGLRDARRTVSLNQSEMVWD